MSRSRKRSQDAPQNISDREPADDVLGEGEDVRANSRTVNGYVGEEVVPGEGDGMEGDEMDDIAEEEELQVDQVEGGELFCRFVFHLAGRNCPDLSLGRIWVRVWRWRNAQPFWMFCGKISISSGRTGPS